MAAYIKTLTNDALVFSMKVYLLTDLKQEMTKGNKSSSSNLDKENENNSTSTSIRASKNCEDGIFSFYTVHIYVLLYRIYRWLYGMPIWSECFILLRHLNKNLKSSNLIIYF